MIPATHLGTSRLFLRSIPRFALTHRKIHVNDLLLHLIDTLSLPLNERGARRALLDFAEEAGFTYYAYLHLRGPATFAVSNYPQAWQDLYVLRDYLRVDPVVTNAKHGPPVFAWSADAARRVGRHGVRQFFSDAADFGIRSGISVSVPVGFRNRMIFTVSGNLPSAQIQGQVDPVTAAVAVTLVHARLNGINGDINLTKEIQLSPREAECLRWFSEGVGMPDIAEMLNLSESTVRSYIHEAKRKVGADNNRQAGTIAARMGLI